MRFTALLPFVIAASATAVRRDEPVTVALHPYLAPLCQGLEFVFENLCVFAEEPLKADTCFDVNSDCWVHGPASFTWSSNKDASQCRIVAYSASDCSPNAQTVETNLLGQSSVSGCIETPFFGNVVNGGFLSGSLLPFGYKSAKLVCS
ncbi:hypothetical protein HWV62_23857 [Athelia sp. TMB]|nr:hypothetical protein HWV62_23857 [Athelia sp. TMB]